jgi:hypothetical protein
MACVRGRENLHGKGCDDKVGLSIVLYQFNIRFKVKLMQMVKAV